MKKLAVISMTAAMLSLQSALPASAAPVFRDVSSASIPWAIDAINFMTDKGVIQGFEDGTFKPNNAVTKAELGMMLYRLFPGLRSTSGEQIPELNGHWGQKELNAVYGDHLYLAAGYHLISGGYLLQPDNQLTRWQLLLILNDMFHSDIYIDEATALSLINRIKDVPMINLTTEDEWERVYQIYDHDNVIFQPTIYLDNNGEYFSSDFDYLKFTALYTFDALGIITADEHGYFRPNDKVTRAEILTILWRVYQQTKEGSADLPAPPHQAPFGGKALLGSLGGTVSSVLDLKYGENKFKVIVPTNAKYMTVEMDSTENVDVYVTYRGKKALITQEELSRILFSIDHTEYVEFETQVREPNKPDGDYSAKVSISFL